MFSKALIGVGISSVSLSNPKQALMFFGFKKRVKIGDVLIFKNAMPYTMVKSSFFNGLAHPAMGIWSETNDFMLIKQYSYQDFKSSLG